MSTSLHTLQVEILRYNNVISLRNVATNIFILRQTASTIATDLLSRQNTSILANLSVFPGLLEQYNIRYTEKWVKRIDENFLEYYYGLKPALNIPHPSPSQSASFPYIYHKFFSGDVSGMIAESIFIYFLDHLGININLIGHLRPMKQRNAYQPDYVIWDGSNAIKTLIQNPQFQPPLYAEVKGSTGGIDPSKISKAFTQLNNVLTSNTDSGLAFIVFKDSQRVSYTGAIIEVTI